LYLAVFPGAIGYASWSYVLARLPVSSTTTYLYYLYFVPLATGLIGWFWLGEVPPGLTVLGGALTLFGVMVVNRYGREPH
jgi:drug/metabolite transporter (DMT)-like permease